MAEPPAKRAKRTDSSTMWEHEERHSKRPERDTHHREGKESSDTRGSRDERPRHKPRDDRRQRSRSRDRAKKTRDRSRSREREHGNGGKQRDGARGRGDRDRRERSVSRERQKPRKDDPPPSSRTDRRKPRSPSPPQTGTPPRNRSPTRKPHASSKAAPKSSSGPTVNNNSSSKMDIDLPQNSTADASNKPAKSSPIKAKVAAAEEDQDPETALLRKLMGFAGFKTTKNTKVPGNNVGAVRKEKTTEYRQYMNRVGGFNRPLSPSR